MCLLGLFTSPDRRAGGAVLEVAKDIGRHVAWRHVLRVVLGGQHEAGAEAKASESSRRRSSPSARRATHAATSASADRGKANELVSVKRGAS